MTTSVQPKQRNLCLRLLRERKLPKSACAKSLIRAFAALFDAGVIRWSKAGGGQQLVVADETGYERWFMQHFPAGVIPDTDSSQIRAVAQFRNAKALRSNLPEIVCLRSTRDGGLRRNGDVVETTHSTLQNGLFAFSLTRQCPFRLRGACALIENLAVFQSFETLALEPTLAIWTAGVSSNRFIEWLAACVHEDVEILHLPDYDPVGLSEFLRLSERLGGAVSLHLPDNLETLFRCYSKRSLLADTKNQRMLMELRRAQHPSVRRVIALMDEFNGGLEHEAMFIKQEATQGCTCVITGHEDDSNEH